MAAFLKKLGNRGQRFRNYLMGRWPRTAKLTPTPSKNESGRKYLGSIRNADNADERNNSVCIIPYWRAYKQSLSDEKER